ncbi:IMP dehydrogenase [Methanocella sp. CWC-04]|uniref:Inosine-5'-monophosphate dehydrogenase n=1 Tax=Methanooceanicella nereidis TaxID=2052831 RepID=A0AAP2RCE4_9EURY|nr:IMP dehydrogenase [Methanocella sp. CWC-04]
MFLKKLDAPQGITFDDVLLVPSRSYVEPDHTDVKSRFSKNISLNVPIVSAAMDTVTESEMAIAMAREGGIGVIHRNMPREQQVEEVRKVKRGEEILMREVTTASPGQTIGMVWRIMKEQSISGIPIIDEGRLVGIISRRDIRPIVKTDPNKKISDVMTRDVVTATEEVKIDEAIDIMYENKIERLPIINEDGTLIGIITMQNILEKRQYPNANKNGNDQLCVAAAVGPFDIERAMALDKAGVDAICVDCAHAHNMRVVESARRIKKMVSADVVVGNIATGDAAQELIGFADGIKVGVGPGSICTTRIVAGVGVPQLTAIAEAVDVAKEHGVPIIADGGVRFSGDIAKAIAAGAESIMLGNLMAGTREAPGRLITIKGRRYKQYRGMGSLGAMAGGECSDRYFQDSNRELGKTKFVPEGVEGAIPYRGTVSDIIYQLIGGVKSSMGYCGAMNIKEMREKSKFIRVTPSGMTESHPHDIMITDEAPNYPLSTRQ